MINPLQKRPKTLWFPLWANVLQNDATLTPGLRQSYRRTIGGFLAFCRQKVSVNGIVTFSFFVHGFLTQIKIKMWH